MKRIAMIIAHSGFQDTEFSVPFAWFRQKGADVKVFSTKPGIAKGSFGLSVEVDGDLDSLDVANYDAIVFVGGSGTMALRDDARAIGIAKTAKALGKAIGAICWSPTILAKAGVLEGRDATVWLAMTRNTACQQRPSLKGSGQGIQGQALSQTEK
jgi:protease I